MDHYLMRVCMDVAGAQFNQLSDRWHPLNSQDRHTDCDYFSLLTFCLVYLFLFCLIKRNSVS